jgi:hypothetical protein
MDSTKTLVQDVSRRNRLSEEAVTILLRALESSGYTMAQFNHSELGGMGQWSAGMIMIGDLSNSDLKGRVERACSELAEGMRGASNSTGSSGLPSIIASTIPSGNVESNNRNWWPETFGTVSSSGSQNGCDYVYSRATNRLAIRRGSELTIYDTGKHEIYGVAQQQGSSSSLEFQSQLGTITAGELLRIE